MTTAAGASELTVAAEPQVRQSPEVEAQLLRLGLICIYRRSVVDLPRPRRRHSTLKWPSAPADAHRAEAPTKRKPGCLQWGGTRRGYKRSPLRPDGSLCPFLSAENARVALLISGETDSLPER